MNDSIFITTSIPYVNSKPHVGHAQEFILADYIGRTYRALDCKVTFQTGTDENAFKNVVAAKAAGLSPQAFVDKNSRIFRALISKLDVSADTFIRTTEARHIRGVEEFWSRLKPEDLYRKAYKGLYCIGCEDFYLDKDLVGGKCPDHLVKPEVIEEENIFFRLSNYQEKLESLIVSDEIKIFPESRKNEALSFIRQGLHDISLTRASARSNGWGIPVPGNSEQVIYVWIDALINYLSGQGFGTDSEWKNIWSKDTRKIHVIGKNVWKFHAVYWPALLLSVGLPVPNEIIVHGFLTNNGVKISKSLGNTIDPIELVEKYGSDALRHLLLTYIPLFTDSDFSTERVAKIYSDDLAHRLGNLYSRLLALCKKGKIEIDTFDFSRSPQCEVGANYFAIQETSLRLWQEIDAINADIHKKRPWDLLSSEDQGDLRVLLDSWLSRLYAVAKGLLPFIPAGADRVILGLEGKAKMNRVLFPLS